MVAQGFLFQRKNFSKISFNLRKIITKIIIIKIIIIITQD